MKSSSLSNVCNSPLFNTNLPLYYFTYLTLERHDYRCSGFSLRLPTVSTMVVKFRLKALQTVNFLIYGVLFFFLKWGILEDVTAYWSQCLDAGKASSFSWCLCSDPADHDAVRYTAQLSVCRGFKGNSPEKPQPTFTVFLRPLKVIDIQHAVENNIWA